MNLLKLNFILFTLLALQKVQSGILQSPLNNYNCNPNSCKPPACLCASTEPPNNLNPQSEMPQLIMLTFDDAITQYLFDSAYSRLLLGSKAKNPDGCPIAATFHVSVQFSDMYLVQLVAGQGHEISCHTVNHVGNAPISEIQGMREQVEMWTNGTISQEDIVGFRAPFLQLNSTTLSYLQQLGFLYDNSVSDLDYGYLSQGPGKTIFPYTLDYGFAQYCDSDFCQNKSMTFPGLWEIPLYQMNSTTGNQQDTMDYVDPDLKTCFNTTFFDHYLGNRAPFGIYLHGAWLLNPTNFDVLLEFVEYISMLPDVWFVTGKQIISFMKNPVPKDQIIASGIFQGKDGICRDGRRYPSKLPTVEICDGMDNDQNGIIDDGKIITSCNYGKAVTWTCLSRCPPTSPGTDNYTLVNYQSVSFDSPFNNVTNLNLSE